MCQCCDGVDVMWYRVKEWSCAGVHTRCTSVFNGAYVVSACASACRKKPETMVNACASASANSITECLKCSRKWWLACVREAPTHGVNKCNYFQLGMKCDCHVLRR